VVEAQVNLATPLAQDTVDSVQALWPSQPGATSFGHLLGALHRLMGRSSSIATVPLAVSGRSCFHLPDRGQSRHGMLCPCLLSLSSLLLVATMVACTLTPSQRYVPRSAEWSYSVISFLQVIPNFLSAAHHIKLPEVTLLELLLFCGRVGDCDEMRYLEQSASEASPPPSSSLAGC
jgi:hypothetical protein